MKDLTEEEKKSLEKYDMNEFFYPYKRVSGNYTHLKQDVTKEVAESMYDMISMFIMCGQRPHHIEADLSRNLHAFGHEGHYPRDLEILSNWCEALMAVDKNLEKHFKLSLRGNREAFSQEKGAKNVNLFLDLIRVARDIHSKIHKKPSWIQRLMGQKEASL